MLHYILIFVMFMLGVIVGCLISWEHFSAKAMGNLIVASDEDGIYTSLEISQKEFSELQDRELVEFRVVKKSA